MRWRLHHDRLHGSGPAPVGRFELAAARFNASEAGRTVAGLVRTLGAPRVSLGSCAGAAEEVRVTVAWELSWYQWGVDVGEEARAVVQLGKGGEVTELDPSARQWNAAATEGGAIVLGAPVLRPVAERPARR